MGLLAPGYVHRDVKPANLLVDRDGHVYVTDFGLAKQVLTRSGATRSGQWVGTLDYVAPEQIRGAAAPGGAGSEPGLAPDARDGIEVIAREGARAGAQRGRHGVEQPAPLPEEPRRDGVRVDLRPRRDDLAGAGPDDPVGGGEREKAAKSFR